MDHAVISRRGFGLSAAIVLVASGGVAAAAPEEGAVILSQGLIESPPTYFDVLTPAGGATKPPVVMICGGAHTGACYLSTADGRPGWVDQNDVVAIDKAIEPLTKLLADDADNRQLHDLER